MLYYLFFLFSCVFLFLVRESREKTIPIFLCLLGVFLCFGYTTGTDWREYEKLFDVCTDEDKAYLFLFYEPGFVFYLKL